MSDADLMAAVKRVAGPYLSAFAPQTSFPTAFWAALTANESGGHLARGIAPEKIQRKEPKVFVHLCLVAAGFDASWGSITGQSFLDELKEDCRPDDFHLSQMPSNLASLADLPLSGIVKFASSWGFTQLMGYHALAWRGITLREIQQPDTHYRCASNLMAGFCGRFGLDPTKDFEEMARCWNTGQPSGVATYDPNYIPNLLNRMLLWQSLG
jgi:hypothetical protein